MPYYSPCPYCGCNLDPGEPCDCQSKNEGENIKMATNESSEIYARKGDVVNVR